MKSKGQINYSNKELKQIKSALTDNAKMPKPLSLCRLAHVVAKALGRSYTGVYYKMLHMQPVRTKRTAVAAPKMVTKNSISFGKPTKIEISDNGMTFYF
jgi:hypothetical protein